MYRILTCIFVLAASAVQAQYLISTENLGQISKSSLEITYGQQFRTGVTLYKALYMTTGIGGGMDTASGLIVMPDDPLVEELPVVAYQHGTTNGPESCPSRLSGGHDAPIAYGGMGYIASAADYLGLGDHDGFHPYIHAATQASAGLDMLIATTEFLEDVSGDPWLGPLFVSGYSQGGHAAAALQRELEKNWAFVFPVTASTPMSGPYDVSGVMFDKIVSDQIYFFPAYIAYVMLGYQEVYGDLYSSLDEVFKPQFILPIEEFYKHNITTTELNAFMINQLILDNTVVVPSKLFRDSVLQVLRNDTIDNPMKVALRDNDVYNWTPEAPTRLLYCEADEQVPYQNALVADSTMNANGAPDVQSMSMDPNADHAGCADLAIPESIRFFDSFLITSSAKAHSRTTLMTVSPNPVRAGDQLMIQDLTPGSEVRFFSSNGQSVGPATIGMDGTVNVPDLNPGLYFLEARSGNTTKVQKVIIR